jgi:hypothetical protein
MGHGQQQVREVLERVRKVWVLLGLMVSFGNLAQAGEVSLVTDGIPRVHLVLDQDPSDANRVVATDLIRVISKITGAEIAFESREGTLPIYLGESMQFEGLPIPHPELEPEGYLLQVSQQGIFLLGADELGTGHAVYTLLHELGCRWIMPGDIGECLPAQGPDLALSEQSRIEAPDFSFRDIWYAYGCSAEGSARRADWLRRNRMNRPPVMHGHNLTNTLAVHAPFEQRPELYSLEDGVRTKSQICTSNPEAVELVTKAIKEHLRKYPETQAYSLCPDDNTDFCECEKCLALDVGHIDRGGKPSVSDRYQVFLNQVLEGLEDEFPNVLVTHYAYNENHTDAPRKIPVHPNTGIFLTTSVFCSAHGIGEEFCESRQDFKQLLAEWSEKTDHVFIYEYDPVPYSGGLPWPMWEAHGKEMKLYRDVGLSGLSIEGQNSWAAYFPNYYVAARMMWDADQDYRAIFEDMLVSFFGSAAPAMRDYYTALASVIGRIEQKIGWGLTDYPEYFPPSVVNRCGEALERARGLIENPQVAARIDMVSLSFDEMKAYLTVRRADSSTSWEDYKASMADLETAIAKMEATNEDFLLATIAREKTAVGLGDRFAKEQGFINEWLLAGPFQNVGMQGHDVAYPPERGFKERYSYSGGDTILRALGLDTSPKKSHWHISNTPKWRGYVDLKPEFDQNDYVCAYAACWVTMPKEQEVEFRLGSNDSGKVFLNGKEVWSNKIERPASVDEDVFTVTLPEGRSEIILKICQTARDWGFYFRITKPGTTEIPEGLEVSLEH